MRAQYPAIAALYKDHHNLIPGTVKNKTVTIRQAIQEGNKKIDTPSKLIMLGTVLVWIVLLVVYASWVTLLVLIQGFIILRIYALTLLPGWRIWAYQHVTDIHQFQRSAELAGLLTIQSDSKYIGIMNETQRQELTTLFQRFSQPPQFEDDPSIPESFTLKTDLQNIHTVVLSSAGINVDYETSLSWDDIYDERIVPVGGARNRPGYGSFHSTRLYFRFECPLGRLEIPMSSLTLSAWELDLMLYVYRGRYEMNYRDQGELKDTRALG